MRMTSPTLVFITLMMLLASSVPTLAEGENPAVADLGSNIYLVDGKKGPIPNLLAADEVEKIKALQNAPFGSAYEIYSPVSPDDQAILVGLDDGVAFLNVTDGSAVAVQLELQLIPISNFVWLDNQTLSVFGLVFGRQPYITQVLFNRRNGTLSAGRPIEGDIPVLVSQNFRKALMVALPEESSDDGEDGGLLVQIPSAAESMAYRTEQSRQGRFRMLAAEQLAAHPRARAIADFAALFDPLGFAASTMLKQDTVLRVLDLETGETRDLLTLEKGQTVLDASFSQDGNKFSIITQSIDNDPARPTYDGALLSELLYRDVTGNLPPAENPFFQGNSLTVLDFSGNNLQTMRAADGDGTVYSTTSWSTDNQTLLVKVNQPSRAKGRRYPQYYLQFLAGSSLRFYDGALKEIRRVELNQVSDPWLTAQFVSPDEVLINAQDRLDHHPFYYNWRSGEFRRIADRPGTFAAVISTNQSRELVFVYSSYTDPADFYRMKWDGSAFARLTWMNEDVRQHSQTKQYPVSFRLKNGSTQTGVLILPADVAFPPKRVPMVVWQEGGPTLPVQNNWFALVESPHALLPNFGIGVLVVPLYGRYGVGPGAFTALADGTNFGQVDIDVQAEIVGQLRARGWASKIGITGCSYGGYFTTQSITRHPTAYDAAHTMCTLVDLFTEWSRGYNSLAPWFEGLPPTHAIAEYQRDSPAYNAKRVRTPLLAFHGTRDFLPITVMENFMLEVINNRVPAKMLKFQDADHGFLRSTPPRLSEAYELYGAQEQILWFRTHLTK